MGHNSGIARGSSNLYGHAVGILVIEAHFPRLPGAIGNASTFPFPVLHKVVKGGTGERVVRLAATIDDPERLNREVVAPWIEAAKELEQEGVRAITSSCGYTAMFQRELAAAVSVPVFASSLLLAPMLSRMLPPDRRVGVVTADASTLGPRHLDGVGADASRLAVVGLEKCPHFIDVCRNSRHQLDIDRFRQEVLGVTRRLVEENPDVRLILLECSLLPPFAKDVQELTGLPVFDFTSMINMVHSAIVRRSFDGFL